MKKTIIRKQGLPQWRDLINSAYYAVLIPVLMKIQEFLSLGSLDFNWKDLGVVALSALVGHIIRKSVEKSKKIDITALGRKEDDRPPFGDPTHPGGVKK